MTYNGHKNRTHWNVALWISNDEGLYRLAKDQIRRSRTLDIAAARILEDLHDIGITHTPDGARYSKTAIRNAIKEL